MFRISRVVLSIIMVCVMAGCQVQVHHEPDQERTVSAAQQRVDEKWIDYKESTNEFFTNFTYTKIEGLEYPHKGVSRRDPTKILRVDGTYYIWYTLRNTESVPVGHENATDEIPSRDWDMADIGYATSTDGFTWKEQGIALKRAARKGDYGWRSLCTPDILMWQGKYYLYYQVYNGYPGPDHLATVSVAVADSPDGPWESLGKPVLDRGAMGTIDQGAIRDPFPLVYKGKIHLYYTGNHGWGIATTDDPLGEYTRHPLNPVLNSGHECCVFPWKGGMAALVSLNGAEKNTVQYAPDGVNFEVMANVIVPPIAPGPFIPDAYADNGNGRGFTWGLCHMSYAGNGIYNANILARFDCDLSLDVTTGNGIFKRHNIRMRAETFLTDFGLTENMKNVVQKRTRDSAVNTVMGR
jgi:hypothetical protein